MGKILSKIRALGGLTLPTAVPPTPGPGENAIYFKTNGLPYYKDSNGVEYPFVADEISVIQNPSFEEWASGKPVGWGSFWRDNGTPPWVWEQSTDRVHGGYSWKTNIPANGVGNGSAQSQVFSLTAGQVVTIKVWAKANSAAQGPKISIDFLTSTVIPDFFNPETNIQGQSFPLTTGWSTKTVSFTVPAGHVNGKVSIGPGKNLTTAAASVFVDHVTVEIVTPTKDDTGWLTPTLLNGWENYGAPFPPAQYRRIDNRVYLRGLIRYGITGQSAFILPEGFRPMYQHILPVITNVISLDTITTTMTGSPDDNQTASTQSHTHGMKNHKHSFTHNHGVNNVATRLNITVTGGVNPTTEAGTGFVSLDEISFFID